MKSKKGMGLEAAKKQVAKKEGIPEKAAAAIIASASRNASEKAKKENPNLKKVKVKKK